MIKFIILLISLLSISNAGNDINLNSLVNEAKKSNKHVMIFLHRTGCPYCQNMIDFTLDDDDVMAKIKKDFIYLDINIKDPGTVVYQDFRGNKHDFAKFIGYNMYPSTLFVDGNDDLVYAKPGFISDKELNKILDYVKTKSYDDVDFDEYEKKK